MMHSAKAGVGFCLGVSMFAGLSLFVLSGLCYADKTPLTPAQKAAAEPKVWVDRASVKKLDLFYGKGSKEGAPVAPFTFVDESFNGTAPKIKVKDALGRKFRIKFPMYGGQSEVKSENVGFRLLWAAGYYADAAYYWNQGGRVSGVKLTSKTRLDPKLFRATGEAGVYEINSEVSFKASSGKDVLDDADHFTIGDPNLPVASSREYAGLRFMLALLNDWDTQDDNNALIYLQAGEKIERWYQISDIGAILGRSEGGDPYKGKDRWNLGHYQSQPFVAGSDASVIHFHYSNKPYHPKSSEAVIRTIAKSDLRWFYSAVLDHLSDDQIKDAFRGSGATQAETDGFFTVFKRRIEEVRKLL